MRARSGGSAVACSAVPFRETISRLKPALPGDAEPCSAVAFRGTISRLKPALPGDAGAQRW